MADRQRGRSLSTDRRANIRHSPSPSPHAAYSSHLSGLGLDQTTTLSSNQTFDPSGSLSLPSRQNNFDSSAQFLTAAQLSNSSSPNIADPSSLLQAQQRAASPHLDPTGSYLSPNLLNVNDSQGNEGAFDNSYFPNNAAHDASNGSGAQAIDPALFLDPNLLEPQQSIEQSVDPSNIMATTSAHSPTPPHLLQPGMRQASSASPHASPSMGQGAFHSPAHSRHASLDPSSAAYPQPGQISDWNSMSFRGHRRTPSDTYSDVSSSAHPSPYMGNNESFDHDNPSPLLGAQQDPALFQDVMNFGQFSLSESNSHVSPAHSPHISPQLAPQQQSLPAFTAANNFGLPTGATMGSQFDSSGMSMNQAYGQDAFGQNDFGQADQMSPPEINIDFAPPSRQTSFEPAKPQGYENALSPPDRSKNPFLSQRLYVSPLPLPLVVGQTR